MDQTQGQLANHLKDQVGFVFASCSDYDRGVEAEAKRLAVSLRVMFHRSRYSISLLEQLPGFQDIPMYDTADPIGVSLPCNMSQLELVFLGEGKYYPRLDDGAGGDGRTTFTSRAEWWKKPVIRDFEGHLFTRADLVLSVADQDGGAHMDPKLNDPYGSLATQNSLQHKFSEGEGGWTDFSQPVSACMRQIAHETLVSLVLHNPDSFPSGELATRFARLRRRCTTSTGYQACSSAA